MKILSFGHLPQWAGGRQNSGLANVIYQLARNMAECENFEEAICATDVFVPLRRDGKLSIFGWSKSNILLYAILHPFISIKWLSVLKAARKRYGSTVSIPGFFFKGLHLSSCIRKFRPEVVHLHGMNACIYEHIVPQKIRIIVTMHGLIGNDSTIQNQPQCKLKEADTCHSTRFSAMFFIASQLINDFEPLYGKIACPTYAIPNAYDSSAFHYIEHVKQSKLTLLTVASISENKGQKRVLEALAQTKLDAKYICIGAGDDKQVAELNKFAEDNGVDFEYVGKKTPSEIREYYAVADFMILPSSTEGFGLVYLEALACGVPVVLPKHLPIVKEKGIIQQEINAVLIDNSSVTAITNMLPTLEGQRFDRTEVSKSVIGYSWDGIAAQYVKCINK